MSFLVSIGPILILIMVAALIGFLFSNYLSGLRIRELLSERLQSRKKIADLKKTHQEKTDYTNSLEKDKLKLVFNNDELTSKVRALINQMAQSNTLIDVLQVKNTDLENQSKYLQTQNEVWENKNQENERTIAKIADEKNILQEQYSILRSENINLKQTLSDSRSWQSQKDELEHQIKSLQEQLSAKKNQYQCQQNDLLKLQEKYKELLSIKGPGIENEILPRASKAHIDIKSVLGSRIKRAEASERDDLKRIKGLGDFMEKKLNKLGIYTFEQISQFDEELMNTISDAIDFFPGKMLRDDWIGQASSLYQIKLDNPSEFRKTPSKSSACNNESDLKKIAGIGPKIIQILNDAGIHTCLQLAQTTIEQLHRALEAASITYRPEEVKTWPKQASLIAAGKWEELKSFKEQLKKGRQ